ncbi:unnamed protein product, partial [marine sediment metagenome]
EEMVVEPATSESLKVESTVPAELVEAQAEPVADKSAEVVPAVKMEEKPAKPRRRRKVETVTSAEPGEDTAAVEVT